MLAILPWTLTIGLLAGVLGGMLGIGGGLIMIPAMLLLLGDAYGPDTLHLYKFASIATSSALAATAVHQHARNEAIQRARMPAIVGGALLGMVIGLVASLLFRGTGTELLKRAFGGFVLATVGFQFIRGWLGRRRERRTSEPTSAAGQTTSVIGIGMPAGFLAGFFGLGGGIWAVPAQHLGLRIPLPNAIANAAVMIAILAPCTAIGQAIALSAFPDLSLADGLLLTLSLAPTAAMGGKIGATLTHRLPLGYVRAAFHFVLAISGLRLLLS